MSEIAPQEEETQVNFVEAQTRGSHIMFKPVLLETPPKAQRAVRIGLEWRDQQGSPKEIVVDVPLDNKLNQKTFSFARNYLQNRSPQASPEREAPAVLCLTTYHGQKARLVLKWDTVDLLMNKVEKAKRLRVRRR